MTFALVAAVAVLTLALVVVMSQRSSLRSALEEAKVDADRNAFEAARLRDRLTDTLVPLTWLWDEAGDAASADRAGWLSFPETVLRVFLVAAYTEVQKALLLDDVEMTEAMVEVRTHRPPRRLPKYPQVPPYLASPEDVAGAARLPDAHGSMVTVRDLPKHDFDVVTTPRVQAAEAHHGAPPEAYRYFVRHAGDEWVETDKYAYEHAGDDPTMAERWRVDPFHPAALPQGIHDLIFPDPSASNIEPIPETPREYDGMGAPISAPDAGAVGDRERSPDWLDGWGHQ